MKKKVIAIILAVAMLASMAFTATALNPNSTAEITFRPYGGDDGPVDPLPPPGDDDCDCDDEYDDCDCYDCDCHDPSDPPVQLPPGFDQLGPMGIDFGTRPISAAARVVSTLDTHDGGTTDAELTNARPHSGIAVRVMNQNTATWTITLSVDEFTAVNGMTPLAGFRLALHERNHADIPSDIEGNNPAHLNFASMRNFRAETPTGPYISADLLSSHQIMSGNFLSGYRGTQFSAQMDILANSFQPLGGAQTQLTWLYVPTMNT